MPLLLGAKQNLEFTSGTTPTDNLGANWATCPCYAGGVYYICRSDTIRDLSELVHDEHGEFASKQGKHSATFEQHDSTENDFGPLASFEHGGSLVHLAGQIG